MKRRQSFEASFDSSFSDSEEVKKRVKNGGSDDDLIDILFENIDVIDSYSSSSESTDNFSLISSEKKVRPYFKPSLPRILKRDIRKKIPIMFINVMNSMDFSLLDSFLRTFCRNDVLLSKSAEVVKVGQIMNLEMPSLDRVIYFLGGMQQVSPDTTYHLSEFALRQRSDMEGTEIVCKTILSCTQIYPVHPGHIAKHILDRLPTENQVFNFPDPTIATNFLSNYDLSNPEGIHSIGLPLLENPSRKKIAIQLTIKVDEQNRIERIGKSILFLGDWDPTRPCDLANVDE